MPTKQLIDTGDSVFEVDVPEIEARRLSSHEVDILSAYANQVNLPIENVEMYFNIARSGGLDCATNYADLVTSPKYRRTAPTKIRTHKKRS